MQGGPTLSRPVQDAHRPRHLPRIVCHPNHGPTDSVQLPIRYRIVFHLHSSRSDQAGDNAAVAIHRQATIETGDRDIRVCHQQQLPALTPEGPLPQCEHRRLPPTTPARASCPNESYRGFVAPTRERLQSVGRTGTCGQLCKHGCMRSTGSPGKRQKVKVRSWVWSGDARIREVLKTVAY